MNPLRTFKEIEDGQGTLTIVGSIQDKPNTKNKIPNKFINAMNYRCVFPINIRKNILNADSPFVLQTTHKKSTLPGAFSFVKANISPMKTSTKGLNYNSVSGRPTNTIQANQSEQRGSTA